jgi:16S rRNA (uracil1498-N3)-methyltransferase
LTSNHFFIEKAKAGGPVLVLEGREHHHLSRVVRLHPGETVWLFDEEGTKYTARIEEVGGERTLLVCLDLTPGTGPRTRICLAQALLKAKTMDFVVQKAAELGLAEIRTVAAERSVAKLEGKSDRKLERWAMIAREASKQSRLGIAPRILAPQPLARFLKESSADRRMVLSEHRGRRLRDIVIEASDAAPSEAIVLIGPEGGWTAGEEAEILGAGYEAVNLGPAVLRAETAALSALSILSQFWIW